MPAITPTNMQNTVKTNRKLAIASDCYIQKFIKFPRIAVMHSYAEFLYAALLESNHDVIAFTPQPKQLRVNGRRYVPDFFVYEKRRSYYVELKPRGEFDNKLLRPLKEAANKEDMEFLVVSNDSVHEQAVLANNWLHIVRALLPHDPVDTQFEQEQLIAQLISEPKLQIKDLISRQNRITEHRKEVALYWLAHKGLIQMSLTNHLINFNTGVSLCPQNTEKH